MMEAGVVLDLQGQPLHWHLPPDRTAGSLPESYDLWEVFWTNRDNISGFAHSHPGSGVPGPSHTDVTTFAAIEAGLGARLKWWIISEDQVSLTRYEADGSGRRLNYVTFHITSERPVWLEELRRVSYDIKM